MRTIDTDLFNELLEKLGKGAKENLAGRMQVSTSYIEKLQRKKNSALPRVDKAQDMADALGVDFDRLFPILADEGAA